VEQVKPDESLRWLSERTAESESDGYCGFDAVGWDADTWVLNSMYEHLPPTDVTHHEVRQHALAEGLTDPLMVGSVNLDERATSTGVSLGLTKSPGPGWRRLRWSELADRVPSPMEHSGAPPCFRWFSYSSWPASIQPPGEGSLDLESLRTLIETLSMYSADGVSTKCRCYFSPMAGGRMENARVFLGELKDIVGLSLKEQFSPSNFWSDDGSWLVYTDYDLSGTKISGSTELISALDSCPGLETLHFSS
jgi:hypothetical protein